MFAPDSPLGGQGVVRNSEASGSKKVELVSHKASMKMMITIQNQMQKDSSIPVGPRTETNFEYIKKQKTKTCWYRLIDRNWK